MFQNLLLSKGLTSLIKAEGREIVSHYWFSVLKNWTCTYPNDSIIVVNYPTHVISTIWQSLKVFSCFDEWIPLTHTSHTLILLTHLTHTRTHVSFIHIRNVTFSHTHIQHTHLSTTHIQLVRLPHTQLTLTWIQWSITCPSNTYHLHEYRSIMYIWWVDIRPISEPFSESENIYFFEWASPGYLNGLHQKSNV